ncbi:nicotinamide mononucleotide permease [Coccidioides immitis H538.4]|uniref:Nicotinamide mononucleotide permease n=1 Tax=Coccidioides immitis H538.4 TaxID=396776 RepID=A0A0J8RIR2_COCIT|nr:nicotinamide mononucleotide permease [Coccidioides immitis H538.4]
MASESSEDKIGPKLANREKSDVESGDGGSSSQLSVSPRKVLRKIDMHLMAPLWVVFVFGFLDRINLGNVAVLGIMKELGQVGNDFNIAVQVFFVPYILLDIPSNIVLKKFTPSTWISLLTFLWGVASMCQGFVKNNGALIACRFFIGVFEAGFVPGCAYLMAMYYKRHEFQKPVLALLGRRPTKVHIGDWAEQAKFLTEEEKQYVLARNSEDVGGGARMDRLDAEAWKRIMSDWKIYVGSMIYIGITVSGYATALFIPSIVNSLGYSGIDSQVHSIPIWVVAAVVTLIVSYLTDRLRHRFGFVVFGVIVASIGYIILLCQGPPEGGLSPSVRYMAVFFVCTGTYIVQPVAIVWMANNLGGHYKRAIGLAIQVGFGNIGGIIASNIFVMEDRPRYFVGYGVSLAMMIFCGVMSIVFAIGLVRENKLREQGKRDDRLQLEERILGNMGDDDPRFRFTL